MVSGVGRNEFIDISMLSSIAHVETSEFFCCLSNLIFIIFGAWQKFMWKLNKSIAKELLPTQPVDFVIEPWWAVCLVNFTMEEFKAS